MTEEGTHRRHFLRMAAGGAAALGAVGVATRLALHGDGDLGTHGLLQLSAGDGSDVRALEVPLGDSLLPKTSPHRWGSSRLPTSDHSMVGFTWSQDAPAPQIRISSRSGGWWNPWRVVPHLHDLPDVDSGEGNGRAGTDLLWVGAADGIQVEVTGHRPDDLELVLLHPAPRTADGKRLPQGLSPRDTVTAQPTVLSRAQWGADESWVKGPPRYNSTIQQLHVHHTANSNNYTTADVPSMLRGIYRYHTHSLGWNDIAYNFLIDQFGTTWEGRAGGIDKPVRGAHTLGFNATSTGVSFIGNTDLIVPSAGVLAAYEQLAAWKLSMYDDVPTGWTSVTSEGSDKFKAGRVVSLPVIDGHRDTNDTECPGQNLYNALGQIRTNAAAIIAAAQVPPITISKGGKVKGTPIVGQTLKAKAGKVSPTSATATYTWLRNGVAIPGATGKAYVVTEADAGAQLSAQLVLGQPGWTSAQETVTADGTTKVVTTTTVKVKGRQLKAVVKVSVVGIGVTTPPAGTVTVKVRNRKKTVPLVNGAAEAHFVGFLRGAYPVIARYNGDGAAMLPSRATDNVTVR